MLIWSIVKFCKFASSVWSSAVSSVLSSVLSSAVSSAVSSVFVYCCV